MSLALLHTTSHGPNACNAAPSPTSYHSYLSLLISCGPLIQHGPGTILLSRSVNGYVRRAAATKPTGGATTCMARLQTVQCKVWPRSGDKGDRRPSRMISVVSLAKQQATHAVVAAAAAFGQQLEPEQRVVTRQSCDDHLLRTKKGGCGSGRKEGVGQDSTTRKKGCKLGTRADRSYSDHLTCVPPPASLVAGGANEGGGTSQSFLSYPTTARAETEADGPLHSMATWQAWHATPVPRRRLPYCLLVSIKARQAWTTQHISPF